MQMFPAPEGDYYRNRLTHSLEVAQVAKSIAIRLNSQARSPFKRHPIDLDLIELAALAHDLGHPPFGHEGEAELDACMKGSGGFEGNAQTLRILCKLEKKILKDPDAPLVSDGTDNRLGLGLTYRSLASILKYDKPIQNKRRDASGISKGYYACEAEVVEEIKRGVANGYDYGDNFKTIECQIMDLADDIAYSTYDLDDALKSGLFGIFDMLALEDEVIVGIAEKASQKLAKKIEPEEVWACIVDVFESQKVFDEITKRDSFDWKNAEAVALSIGKIHRSAKTLASVAYTRHSFTSHLVGEFIRAVKVEPNKDHLAFSRVFMEEKTQLKVEVLKHMAFQFLIDSPRWKITAHRSRKIISHIFNALTNEESSYELMPEDFRAIYKQFEEDDGGRKRTVCDFIACMTDEYAVEFYNRLQSGDSPHFFKPF